MQFRMFAHSVAVAADVDEMAVVQHSIDEGSGHDIIAQDLAPLFEALVGSQHGRGTLVAPIHELEEQHRAGVIDWQIPDLIDDEQ